MLLPIRLAGLRARLVLLILLGLVPVAGLTLYMVWEQQRAAADEAKDQALRLARLAASRYAQLTDSAAQLLATAARLPEVAAARMPDCAAVFAQLLDGHRGYVSLGLIDSAGSVRCNAHSGGTGALSNDPVLAMHALQARAFVLGNYYFDPLTRTPTVHAAFPILDGDRDARMVVYAALDLAWLNALAADALLPPGATLTVINRHGVMLARFPAADARVGRPFRHEPMVEAILARGGEGTAETEGGDGVRRLYGFTPLRGSLDPGHAFVAVGIPESIAYASVNNLLRTAAFGALLVAIIAWLAIWKGADILVLRNVQALVRTARRVAAGELDARTGVTRGGGEIIQLARTFDDMAAILQARADESLMARAALQHSEERFRRLAENARDVIYRFRVAPAPGFEYVSPAASEMTGYAPEEFYADPELSRKLVHPDDRPIADALLRGERVQPEPLELRWVRRDGAIIWTEQRNVYVYEAGRLIEVEGIVRDITERKRVFEELRLLQTVTAAVSAAGNLDDALGIVLQRVCAATGWVLGQAWVPIQDGSALICSRAWYSGAPGLEGFRAHSQELTIRPRADGGLLSRVFETRAPVWLRNVTLESAFVRGPQAERAGLKAAIAVPVMVGTDLEAIIEFFMLTQRPEDDDLVRTVSGVAAQLGSVIRHKRSEAQLTYLAHHDLLTDLPNRALFNDRLRQAMLEADRYERLVGVAFLDLDRFKTINDSLGHETGDLLLKSVAGRLRACVRAVDTVARISGDEFTIILPDLAHPDDAARVANKIVDNFHRPFQVAGLELYVTASIGLTLYPADEADVKGLLRNADVAMYRAKEKGRNTYELYAAEMTARAQEQLALEGALRRALEHDQFLLEYQPVVDMQNERIVGVEALLRWRHPERGVMPPAQFIPLAEETGLIVPIGTWVLAHACAQAAAWRKLGYDALRVSVNISARQFQQPGLMDVIATAVRDTGFDPAQLDLEITESLLVHNVDAVLATMEALNRMGVTLSIDDFGTGYSSLGYLKRFPIDRLKIDRSFVKDIPGDADDAAIAAAIIAMAHKLGIQVIAEGVETTEQLAFLRAHGCHEMQGEYFSGPLPAEEFSRLLATARPLPLALADYTRRRKKAGRAD